MLAVKELGHVGIYCTDLQRSKDFYTRILGLTVTDEDPDGNITFLSAQPEEEHHEVALCPGRDVRHRGQRLFNRYPSSWKICQP